MLGSSAFGLLYSLNTLPFHEPEQVTWRQPNEYNNTRDNCVLLIYCIVFILEEKGERQKKIERSKTTRY